ncbi:STAS domain-containing protein [Micromonospora sp. WMMD1274]|uniref:STAS domain-containing protein n=1 Tax=Micromonospora sp. WMMD1274 TaxID=3404116 RepID=UPI003B940E2A
MAPLRRLLAALGTDTVRDVEFDLTGLDCFAAAATSTLVACRMATHVRGGILRLSNIAPAVRRQLFAAGLLGLFDGHAIGGRCVDFRVWSCGVIEVVSW